MKKFNAAFLLVLLAGWAFAQNSLYVNAEPGTVDYIRDKQQLRAVDANSDIATSYTLTACGLSYTQASVFLSQKSFTFGPGMAQPATISVTGLPYCQSVLKAFLYVSTSGSNTPITATLTNPQNVTNSFSMTNIGQGADVCWGYGASQSYRADITSIVTGAGVYTLSGIPVGPSPGSDAQGATIFIIYKDVTQNFSGSIVIADGAGVSQGGTKTATIGGFNVCGTPNSTSHFMLVSDLQKIANAQIKFNSVAANYSLAMANQNAHDFVSASISPVAVGQTTAQYGVTTGIDCWNIVLAGTYFRTSCLTCTVAQSTPPNTPTISIATSSNVICAGNSVTLSASGASTYSWSNGSNNSSIVVTPSTTTQYWVYSNNAAGCSNAVHTQSVVSCTGLQEFVKSVSVELFPNPNKGLFNIRIKNDIEKAELQIYNSLGQLIHKNELKEGENSVNISKPAPGYYYATISCKGVVIHREKFVIE